MPYLRTTLEFAQAVFNATTASSTGQANNDDASSESNTAVLFIPVIAAALCTILALYCECVAQRRCAAAFSMVCAIGFTIASIAVTPDTNGVVA